jgi:hypothetical protein
MKLFLQKNHRIIFYSFWIILGLIQSRFTELQDDEAYYWVYSKFPDWGYFDHPPMIAMLVKIGYAVFHNELGIRLITLLLNTLTLLIIEKLTDRKNPFLFYAIILSIGVLQVAGFTAAPDNPLIFFTALTFLCYKKFLEKPSLQNTILLSVVMAALLYSKYHGILVIFFIVLSNLKLFLKYQLYLAGVIVLIFYSPHLWWQYQHNWISFRYHLFESNVNAYKFSYTLQYIGGQILLAGPIAGIILLPASLLYKSTTLFERALKFTLAGVFVFFLISSFRGKVEANWTSPVIVPLIVLAYDYLNKKTVWRIWLYRILPISVALILFLRTAMIFDILSVKAIRKRYHSWKKWPEEMRKRTKNLPVVFNNSYQRASKYWFCTGQMCYSLNWYRERKNSYNFWPIEDSLLGKPVYIMDIYNLQFFKDSLKTPIGWVGYRYDSAFASFANVKIIPSPKKILVAQDSSFTLTTTVQLSPHYYNYILNHPELNTKIVIGIFSEKVWIKDVPVNYTLKDFVEKQAKIEFNPRLEKGKYYMIFSIFSDDNYPPHNSDKIELVIE